MEITASTRIVCTVAGILGFFFCLLGSLLLGFYNAIVARKVENSMLLSPSSESYEKWREAPVDIFFKVYIFNVTNPEEIMEGKKIRLKEVGPFSFLMRYNKNSYKWDDAEHNVHYNLTTTYNFVVNKSVANLNQEVLMFNVPLLIGVNSLLEEIGEDQSELEKIGKILDEKLTKSKEKLFIRRKVGSFLFEKFVSGALNVINDVAGETNHNPANGGNSRFTFFYEKNVTMMGPFVANAGKKGFTEEFNWIKSYQNKTHFKVWKTEECNRIRGTDGYLFPPGMHPQKIPVVEIVSFDHCRVLQFDYEKDEYVEDVPTSKFVLGKYVYEDARKMPENACFCMRDKLKDCPQKGLLDLKPCTGKPYYASNPHFYESADRLREEIDGIHPDDSKHKPFINIHMITGFVIMINKATQINIELRPMKGLSYFNKIKKTMVPLIWFQEVAKIDEKNLEELRAKVIKPIHASYVALVTSICVGLFAVMSCLSLSAYFVMKRKVKVSFGSSSDIVQFK